MQIDRLFAEAQGLHQRGKLVEAKKRYERILQHKATFGPARLFLALILQQTGQIRSAVGEARRAMEDMDAPSPGLWVNYGIILKNAGLLEEAQQAYQEALAIQPDLLAVKANLSSLYLLTGKIAEAEALCRELTTSLEEAGPWLNLARIALTREDNAQALECVQRAEDIAPKHPDVSFLRAKVYGLEKDDAACFDELRKTLRVQPAHAEAWAWVRQLDPQVLDLDFLETAAAGLAKTKVQQVSLLTIGVDLCRKYFLWKPLADLEALLTKALDGPLDRAPGTSACFTLLGANVPQRGHLKAATATWEKLYVAYKPLPARTLSPRLDNPIRVGFLSYDLRGHAIGFLIVGLLESLPQGRVQWYAYNNSFSDASDSRNRIRSSLDRFVNVAPLTDREVAERVREDNIDILIDLNGITRDTRAQVLAFRPAPIQITWLGMPGTLGAGDAVDYVIGDAWTTYAGNADGFSEKILQLPRSYQPNDHVRPDLSLSGSRGDNGLPEEGVVFCCFNQQYKISPDTFALWCRILSQVEGSVLWLMDMRSDAQRDRLRSRLELAGIDPARLVLAASKPQAEHIARISLADLVLDTWPYNAHTTCSDALRVGVPVVTLPGETFASRVAASILTTGNLADWIVKTPQAYVEKAVAFASQSREAIDAVKRQVRETYWASPMVDNALFAKQFEALCLGLYDWHAAGHAARPLLLDAAGNLRPLDLQQPVTPSAPTRVATNAVPEPHGETASPEKKSLPPKDVHGIRFKNLQHLQQDIIGMEKLPLVVDIGAAAIDGPVGFEALADHGLVELLGFEPSPESYENLLKEHRPHRQYEPVAVGDGNPAVLHLCRAPGMNSLLNPDKKFLSIFPMFDAFSEVKETKELRTTRLDEVSSAASMDMLKCDTQGSELTILKNAKKCLQHAVLLQLELSPTPLYGGEAGFFEVGKWLNDHGWALHMLPKLYKKILRPFGDGKNTQHGRNHIFQVDAVFIPNLLNWDKLNLLQLQNLSFLAHCIYRSYDLSARALWTLDQRDNGERVKKYAAYLKEAGFNA